MIADIPISSGDPWAFMKALDYIPVSSYVVDGSRFTQANTSLLLYRVLVRSSESDELDGSRPEPLSKAKTCLMDPSGNYILQATVRVQDGSKIETMTKGANELMALKETLKGVIDLEMAERLSLDTRVR